MNGVAAAAKTMWVRQQRRTGRCFSSHCSLCDSTAKISNFMPQSQLSHLFELIFRMARNRTRGCSISQLDMFGVDADTPKRIQTTYNLHTHTPPHVARRARAHAINLMNSAANEFLCAIKWKIRRESWKYDCSDIDFSSFRFLFHRAQVRCVCVCVCVYNIILSFYVGFRYIISSNNITRSWLPKCVALTWIWYGTSQTIREQSTNVSDHFLWWIWASEEGST